MTDAPDELESAMILGDPHETVSLDTIKAMAQAVRDAGYGSIEAERARILAPLESQREYAEARRDNHPVYAGEASSLNYAIAIVKGEA